MSTRGCRLLLVANLAMLALFAAACCGAQAQVPDQLTYQGYLTDAGGTAITGSRSVVFTLYNAGGTAVYSETQTVNVANGAFSVAIGSITPMHLPFDVPYFLGIKVGTDTEMTPRQALLSSPYAQRADTANLLAATATIPTAQLSGTVTTAQIANNAITQAKLYPTSGASPGKVLGTDGANLVWQSGSGSVTALTPGTGIVLSPNPITTTGNIAVDTNAIQIRIAGACALGNFITSIASDGGVSCQADSGGTVKNIGIGPGLTGGPITNTGTISLAATQLLPVVACAATQIPKWTGSSWGCAADDIASIGGNLTLANPSTAVAGNIMKGANRFIHNFGSQNTFVGENAGNFSMTGGNNTGSGLGALFSNTGGANNTASGVYALLNNTTGVQNTADGVNALFSNADGYSNTAVGVNALSLNTSGFQNTGIGVDALFSNSTGINNTAVGLNALYANGAGSSNTAVGSRALLNSNSDGNTAIGANSLQANTSGAGNTANGTNALLGNIQGDENSAFGYLALSANANGNSNTAVGYKALANLNNGNDISEASVAVGAHALIISNGAGNTAVGTAAMETNSSGFNNTGVGTGALVGNATGHDNVAIGYLAGSGSSSGNYNIYIGSQKFSSDPDDRVLRIGTNLTTTFIGGIRGATLTASPVPVLIDSNGQLGIVPSSLRYKDEVADMASSSSRLMDLRPVTFYYKTDGGPARRSLQYGLIAEEVAEVYPGLVAHSADGQVESVMYQFLAPMLLNEYQKQQRTIERQAERMNRQTGRIAELERDRNVQTAEIAELKLQAAEIATLKEQLARVVLQQQATRSDTINTQVGLK